MDANSALADPSLVDPLHGDFRVTSKSQQTVGGFVPFDLSTVGPR
jgi:hypothetical protein